MTDVVLSTFVSETGVEPAVAQDILDSHEWDLHAALRAYSDLRHTMPPPASAIASKPVMRKEEAVDISDVTLNAPGERKWARGISRASENLPLVTRARTEAAKGFTLDDPNCIPCHTFTLPDLTVIQPDDFKAFVENDLIETATLISLEQAGRLNWWAENKPCQRLLPLATTGDGNCLLHAASLGIWGYHDRLLTLRKSLNYILSKSEYEASIYRRWRWHQTMINKQSGLIYTESEWEKEWFAVLKLSSAEPRVAKSHYVCCENSPNKPALPVVEEQPTVTDCDNTQYESLEEIHVFALAYAIRRPIIVTADVYLRDSAGDPLAPIPFGGIYLPLGRDPKTCLRSPLILAYDAAHFSALVPMKKDSNDGEDQLPAVIPITDAEGRVLPILFLVDPGESFDWENESKDETVVAKLNNTSDEAKLHILRMYLDLVKVTLISANKAPSVDDRRSTADSNESESSSGSQREKLLSQKSGFSKGIKSVRQKLKRSISKLTRRTSEDKDVALAMRGDGSTGVVLEKNVVNANRKVEKETVGDKNGAVQENTLFKWKVEEVEDVSQCAEYLNNTSVVFGAPLSLEDETSFHEQMISNYLTTARARYDAHLKDKERHGNLKLENGKIRCANFGCEQHGSVATNYLCPACFSKQKTQMEEMKAQRQTTTIGNSTFYANRAVTENEPVLLSNTDFLPANESSVHEVDQPTTEEISVRPCVTPDCVFFGQKKTNYLCSSCYKLYPQENARQNSPGVTPRQAPPIFSSQLDIVG